MSKHTKAVLQALFVTLLWSSSWVFIKIGLQGIPPITFAGFRYFLGFLLLLPFVFKKNSLSQVKALGYRQWVELILLGLVMYCFTQGAQFLSLKYFSAVFTALILNFTPIVVAAFSIFLLKEIPRKQQVLGIFVCLVGACLYFLPKLNEGIEVSWLLWIPIGGMVFNAISSILGRHINKQEHVSSRLITVIGMGVGSLALLVTGVYLEDFPSLTGSQVLLIVWLAGINTAFAFTLWNHTFRTLSSVESSVINNTMMVQIAFLAVFVLGENLSLIDILALVVASLGALLVQLKRNK